MKLYAKQVAPECQESDIFGDETLFETIAVCGNRQYQEHGSDMFKQVKTALEDGVLANILEDIETDGYYSEWYKNATQAFEDYLPCQQGAYTPSQIGKLKNLVRSYATTYTREHNRAAAVQACVNRDYILCRVLSIVTGQTWEYKQIHGCCQSEWNNIYYPKGMWTNKALLAFEVEYFNMGTEWIIDDGDFDPENDSPLNINGTSIYCTSCAENEIRKEIAECEGVNPLDVVLYIFEGYVKTPQYKVASA